RIINQGRGHASAHYEIRYAPAPLVLVLLLVLVIVLGNEEKPSTSRSTSTITKRKGREGATSLVFRDRPDTVCADEQDGHRSPGPRGFADQWRLRRFPWKQRQGFHYLRRPDRGECHHHVHARCLEGTAADPRFDGPSDDGARSESGAGYHQRPEKRDL